MNIMDKEIPVPPRDLDKPFLMSVEQTLNIEVILFFIQTNRVEALLLLEQLIRGKSRLVRRLNWLVIITKLKRL